MQTKAALDFETTPIYNVTVLVSDGRDAQGNDNTSADDTIEVTIEVTNVDENGEVTFSPSQPQVDTPLTATLTDPDGGVTGVNWSWERSSDKTNWSSISDAASESYTPVEADLGDYLRATASYTDGQGPSKTAVEDPENAVQAAPVTNEPPAFPSTEGGSRSVAENTAAGENIGAPVTATDDDSDELTYTLDSAAAAVFHIVPESGQLQTEEALDHEAKSSYTVTVTATDPSNETDTIEVTITVTDEDEPPPAPGAPMVEAAATDGHKTLNVSWEAPDVTDRPAIDRYDVEYREQGTDVWGDENVEPPGTGTSATISGLTPGTTYEVQVRAVNDEGESGWSGPGVGSTASLTVAYSQAAYSVNEGESVEITVTLSSEAAEVLDVPISVEGGGTAEEGDYQILGLTGGVLVLAFAQVDTSQTFTITTGQDTGWHDETVILGFGTLPNGVGEGNRNTTTVTIYDDETQPSGGNTGGGNTGGGNTGGGNTGGGNTGGGNTGGSNSGGSASDHDEDDTLVTRLDDEPLEEPPVEEKDEGGDVKDADGPAVVVEANRAPEFTEGDQTGRTVAEQTATATVIGLPVSATDADGDPLTYSIVGADGASFAIDSGSGQLSVGSSLDFEIKAAYTFAVSVSDGRGGTQTP